MDERGVLWRVWQTYPARGSAHPEALRDGWLTFECADCKKRLVPIPDGWEQAPEVQLAHFLNSAEEYRRGRPSPPSSPST